MFGLLPGLERQAGHRPLSHPAQHDFAGVVQDRNQVGLSPSARVDQLGEVGASDPKRADRPYARDQIYALPGHRDRPADTARLGRLGPPDQWQIPGSMPPLDHLAVETATVGFPQGDSQTQDARGRWSPGAPAGLGTCPCSSLSGVDGSATWTEVARGRPERRQAHVTGSACAQAPLSGWCSFGPHRPGVLAGRSYLAGRSPLPSCLPTAPDGGSVAQTLGPCRAPRTAPPRARGTPSFTAPPNSGGCRTAWRSGLASSPR